MSQTWFCRNEAFHDSKAFRVMGDECKFCDQCGKGRPAERVEDGLDNMFENHQLTEPWQDFKADLRKWRDEAVRKALVSCGQQAQCPEDKDCAIRHYQKIPSEQAGASGHEPVDHGEDCALCEARKEPAGEKASTGATLLKHAGKIDLTPAEDGGEKAGELWEVICRAYYKARHDGIPEMNGDLKAAAQAALDWLAKRMPPARDGTYYQIYGEGYQDGWNAYRAEVMKLLGAE